MFISISDRSFGMWTLTSFSGDLVVCFLVIIVVIAYNWLVYAGDLGQSFDSNKTLTHYELNPQKGQAVLFVGDLSYADNYPNHDNVRWDTWGRFVERSVAYQPWIWTAGNHEIDFEPDIVRISEDVDFFIISIIFMRKHCLFPFNKFFRNSFKV